jgi:putative transposase
MMGNCHVRFLGEGGGGDTAPLPDKSRKTDTPRFRIPQRVVLDGGFISVPKIGSIRTVVHRPLEGVTKSATFKREACGHWYVSLVTEQSLAPRTNRPVQTHIGIDLGLKSLAVLSTGETIENPRWYRTQARKLRRAQQALSRKVKGSANRTKARIVVARLHQKTRNQRNDFLHKLSTNLVRHFDLISIEDLHVRGLAKTKLACDVRLSLYLFCSATLPRQNLLSHQQYP